MRPTVWATIDRLTTMSRRNHPSTVPQLLLLSLLSLLVIRHVDGTPASSVRVLNVANGGGGPWSRAFTCMPQNHGVKTTPTFNKPSIPLVYLRYKAGTGETCVTQAGPVAADGTATTVVTRSAFEFEPADLAALNNGTQGAVALVRGSSCAFSNRVDAGISVNPWDYYLRDFQARVDAALDAGAAGVLWGEGVAGKLPENMHASLARVLVRRPFNSTTLTSINTCLLQRCISPPTSEPNRA